MAGRGHRAAPPEQLDWTTGLAKAQEVGPLSLEVEDATAEAVQAMMASPPEHFSIYDLAKARSESQGGSGAQLADPKGLTYDPFTALDQLGFRERPNAMTFATLAEMARKTGPIAAIIQTRVNQMAAFAEPQRTEFDVGFKIELADRREELTEDLQKRAYEIERFVMRCGDPAIRRKRARFNKYIRTSTWDSLVYDQMTTEIIPTRKGTPGYWRALDAATIRVADDLEQDEPSDDDIAYVQVYDDTIVAEFTESEMLFGVRNPRSDIRFFGYGTSELELLITIVTSLLWGIDYNSKFFTQGTVAKGLINFKGTVPEHQLQAFRRQWYAQLTGVGNAWRTPVTNSDEVQYINMQTSNRDMEFSEWINWLLKVACGVYQISPEEIGFQFGNTGQQGSMHEGNQEQKIKWSKDKGLVPLAKFMGEEISEAVIQPIDDRFVLRFVGVNQATATELVTRNKEEVSSFKTVDEVRAERGMEPMPDKKGEVILNPVWAQLQQGGGEMEGGDGDDPFGEDDGFPGDEEGEDQDPKDEKDGEDGDATDDDKMFAPDHQDKANGVKSGKGDAAEKSERAAVGDASRGVAPRYGLENHAPVAEAMEMAQSDSLWDAAFGGPGE